MLCFGTATICLAYLASYIPDKWTSERFLAIRALEGAEGELISKSLYVIYVHGYVRMCICDNRQSYIRQITKIIYTF